jgi:PEP-CTERM motif
MKKFLLIAAITMTVAYAAAPHSNAQTASFIFNDNSGAPAAGSYAPGSTFTLTINVTFAPGGTVANLEGLSYWFEATTPNPPFNFAITLRDVTGSMFTDLQTPGLTYPQNLGPQSAGDLGALLPGVVGLGAGNYLVANLTFSIAGTAAPGVYQIRNTISGGKTSFAFSDTGTSVAIPGSLYTITVVPEPSTYALLGLAGIGLAGFSFRRRIAAR